MGAMAAVSAPTRCELEVTGAGAGYTDYHASLVTGALMSIGRRMFCG
jgi:hypothetical protein